ncbi:hypothetical protein JOF53_001198 [Crossiella equi]|uniref:ABC-2 family transporter protein n=1 Tax=Crossiella equi TaxID=130796 RepID=A0ABS5A7P6_9PSEU|nr:hypothetical protein [Crossiella equi]MBP2472326.1 hypothetical protein [Crossiella equi]
MTWLAWRQHRLAVLLLLGYALLGVTGMLVLGLHVESAFTRNGLRACLTDTPVCPDTAEIVVEGFWQPGGLLRAAVRPLQFWLAGSVVLAGLLVGAPLFAREYAQGTQRFALTQSVGPARWYLTKLAVVAVPAVLAATALQLAYLWLTATLGPVLRTWPRFEPGEFELRGLVLPFYTLFAVVLGAVVGLLARRLVAAISVTLVAVALLVLVVPTLLRPHYQPPVFEADSTERPVAVRSWLLDSAAPNGPGTAHVWGPYSSFPACPAPNEAGLCVHGTGAVDTVYRVQPGDRFWTFQYVEAGLFLLLTAGVLALGAWALRRRPG